MKPTAVQERKVTGKPIFQSDIDFLFSSRSRKRFENNNAREAIRIQYTTLERNDIRDRRGIGRMRLAQPI
jgi:hypothetical protein